MIRPVAGPELKASKEMEIPVPAVVRPYGALVAPVAVAETERVLGA